MNGFWGWETLGVVLTLLAVFFGGTLAFVAVVGLAVGLLSALVLFAVPVRWRRALVQAIPTFWPKSIRQKYRLYPDETDPTCVVTTNDESGTTSGKPERFGSLNKVPALQGRRLLGVHGFSQMNVQDIEDDESVWLLEFEGGWWAGLVMQIAPAWISPTFQLAWDVYGPGIQKPDMADSRIEQQPGALSALVGTLFLKEAPCVSTETMVLEVRLNFAVDGENSEGDVLVLRLGYLDTAENYLRTGKLDDLGHQGLDAQVVPPGKVAEMDDWELKRRLQRPIRNLGPVVLEQWLAPNHFPACAAPWNDVEHVARLRALRCALTEFLKWFRPSYKLSDSAEADPKRPELKWSWPVQFAVLEDALERITAWELLVNAGLVVNPETGHLMAAADEALACGGDLRWELPVLGLGTLFTPAWWANTSESELASTASCSQDAARLRREALPTWIAGTGTVPQGLAGQEIPQDFLWTHDLLKRYAPVRQAYRHWFLQFRGCYTHGLRLTHQWTLSEPIPWVLTLDAALERRSMKIAELSQVPGALVLYADIASGSISDDVPTASVPGQARVWIEGDEEAPDCLRITLTPEPASGQPVQIIRVPRDVLAQWWLQQRPPAEPLWCPLAHRLQQLLSRKEVASGELKVWHADVPVITLSTLDRDKPYPLRLPPFTQEDLDTVEQEWQHLPAEMPRWVVALDQKLERWVFPLGWDTVAARPQVRFPSVWPAGPSGRGAVHTRYDLADHVSLRAQGDAARPTGWQLRVQAWYPDATVAADAAQPGGLWGLMDIDGRLVLPLIYTRMSPVQSLLGTLSQGTAAPLPAGRIQPWQWAEVLATDQAPTDAHGRKVCDVIEVWSGQRVNPPGVKALQGSLTWGYFTACHDSTDPCQTTNHTGAEVGLMLCTQSQPGPLRWASLNAGNAVNNPMSPARCPVSGLLGYIGALGQTVMEPCFEEAGNLDNDLTQVRLTLADSQAQGLALTLPDGQLCGPAGVLVVSRTQRADELPTWRWLLAPRWRNVGGEYDGHFSVQEVNGAWAMVTPDGEPVTPFTVLAQGEGTHDDGHAQAMRQFKNLQTRRFMGWLLEAVQVGTLAVMHGHLHSSYGSYDYGALPGMNLALQITREVMALVTKYGPTRDEEVVFAQGTQFVWNPAQRKYAGFVDLRTHAVVGEAADRDQNICIPWDALALAVNSKCMGQSGDQDRDAEATRWLEILGTPEHLNAMRNLRNLLDNFNDWLDLHPINPQRSAQPPWQAHDARRSCGNLAKLLHRLEVYLALRDTQGMHSTAQWLQRELWSVDLPSLFTRQRYETNEGKVEHHIGNSVPLWLGVEGTAAIAPDHPWVRQMLPQWDLVLSAYVAWKPYFSKAAASA